MSPLRAANLTWDTFSGDGATITGGDGTWDTNNTNWNTGAGNTSWVNANKDLAIFSGTAGTVTLGSDITASGITLSSGYTIAGGGFTLSLDNGASPAVISKNASGTISANLASSGAVTISGNSNLSLSGNNTGLTGTVSIGGTNTVTLGNANALGTAAVTITAGNQPALGFGSAFTLNNSMTLGSGSSFWTAGSNALNFGNTVSLAGNAGATLWGRSAVFSNQLILGANAFTLNSATSSSLEMTLSGVVSGTGGSLVKNGTSTTLNLTGSGANTFTGGITFNAGSIRVGNNNAALGTGTLTVSTTTANASTTNLLATSNGGGARTLANRIVINNNGTGTTTLQLDGGWADLNLSGSISGNGGISTTSSGTIRLTGTNSYTGSTVLAGTNTLILSGSNTTSGVTIGASNTLALRNITLAANITGAGRLQKDGAFFGTAVLTGNNNNYTGTTTVNIDWFRLASTGVINGTSGITVQGQWSARYDNLGSTTTTGALAINGYAGSGTASESGIFFNGNSAGTTPGSLTAASITLGNSFRSAATSSAKGGEFFNYANSTVNLGTGAVTVNGQGNELAGGMVSAGSQFNNAGTVTAGSITLNSSSTANTASSKGGTYTQSGGTTTISGSITLSANGGTGAAGTAGNDAALNLTGGTINTPTLALDSGTVTATGGTLNLGSGGITSAGGPPVEINLGAAAVGATAAWTSSLGLNLIDLTTGTTFDTTGGSIELSGPLSGSGNLVKTGSNTLLLGGSSTAYSGVVSVSAGTLLVNGNLGDNSTDVSVGSGAIGGTGTIGGNLTLGGSSFLHVFNLSSPLTVGGLLSFASSGFGINSLTGIDWDIIPEGTHTLVSGSLDPNLLDHFGYANRTAVGSGGGKFAYFENGSLQLVVVPEPHTAFLSGMAALMLLKRRRPKTGS